MSREHVDVYTVHRKAGSVMSGCIGAAYYDRLAGNLHDCEQTWPWMPELVIDENLGTGSIVRVTTEIVHFEPVTSKCINPFGQHSKHTIREGA